MTSIPLDALQRMAAMTFNTDAGEKTLAWLEERHVQRRFRPRDDMTAEASALYDAGARDVVLELKHLIDQGQANAR